MFLFASVRLFCDNSHCKPYPWLHVFEIGVGDVELIMYMPRVPTNLESGCAVSF